MLSIPVTIIVWVLFVSTLILFTIVIWLREKLQKEEDRYIQLNKDDFLRVKLAFTKRRVGVVQCIETVIVKNYYIFHRCIYPK